MIERGSCVPASSPRRFTSEPAATLRTTISSGMISTSLISCSRMLMRRMKWVGMPSDVQLGEDELGNAVVEDALAVDDLVLGAVAGGGVVLEILDESARLRALVEILGLALINLPTAVHWLFRWQ